MPKTLRTLPPVDRSLIETDQKHARGSRRARQKILNSMPAQIDAIKAEREMASIELRHYVMKRESDQKAMRSEAQRLERWKAPFDGPAIRP